SPEALTKSANGAPSGMFGSGCASARFSSEKGPCASAAAGNAGVERGMKSTVVARATIFPCGFVPASGAFFPEAVSSSGLERRDGGFDTRGGAGRGGAGRWCDDERGEGQAGRSVGQRSK